ncbi:FAD-dependent oxidoreductase [Nocardia brasiliensis]|uniref:FAD-dependent oxidoreductase n=1 Tax=Nocardia brasiliensis TaxID=37326 RepID=UPI003D17598C
MTVDVLVLGGGPAGTWAALQAAASGTSVALADKGFCGSSGERAMASREAGPLGAASRSAPSCRAARRAMIG